MNVMILANSYKWYLSFCVWLISLGIISSRDPSILLHIVEFLPILRLNNMVLEKILESPLDCKEIQPVHPEGNQSRMFTGRTDVEAEAPIFWPPDVKSWLIGKDSDSGKDWGQEEKGTTEDEMVGWHHWLNGHGFGWWIGRPGMLWFMGLQRVGHDWVTELNWTEYSIMYTSFFSIHSSIDGHLVCFYSIAIMNRAAMNLDVLIILWDPDFSSLGYIPRSDIAGS